MKSPCFAMLLLAVLLLLPFSGCSADYLWRGLYGGIKTRNDLQSPPPERFGKPESPDYSEYKRLIKEQR